MSGRYRDNEDSGSRHLRKETFALAGFAVAVLFAWGIVTRVSEAIDQEPRADNTKVEEVRTLPQQQSKK